MAKTIQIAPEREEITREANTFKCEFNNMAISWSIAADCSDMDSETEDKLKDWLSMAIAMSDHTWQVPYLLNKNLPFKSEVYINGKKVDYPNE